MRPAAFAPGWSRRHPRDPRLSPFAWLFVATLLLPAVAAHASVGLTEIPGHDESGPVTVFYPSRSEATAVVRGPFTLELAENGAAADFNRRLVVISHGSGGGPWAHTDLAATLVDAGFVVALPEHFEDNYKDTSQPGPPSWKRRPFEVSSAIDAIGRDPRFGPKLDLDRVGAFGISAGGHTVLTLAGGRWSPSRLRQHCDAHIADDFQSCVGLSTSLTGGFLDGTKKTIALWVIDARFDDETWYGHTDPRIAAAVAGVPFAADFDLDTLASPPIPLALITARHDKWLVPQFHSDPLLRACSTCEHLFDFADGGHGALLSPPVPGLDGLLATLLDDPPGFDRSSVRAMNEKVVAFFRRYLLQQAPPHERTNAQ